MYKKNILFLFLFFIKFSYAQDFRIDGIIENPANPYLTLINMIDNSVTLERKCDVRGEFSIFAPEGSYALCIGDNFNAVYFPIILKSNSNLGSITYHLGMGLLNGYELEKQGDIKRYVLTSRLKKYDALTALHEMSIFDFRTKKQTCCMGTVKIDKTVLDKNILELVEYLQAMPAKHVKYVETYPPTEQSPGGIIHIVTISSVEKFWRKIFPKKEKLRPLSAW